MSLPSKRNSKCDDLIKGHTSKQKKQVTLVEENNNEIDGLSTIFEGMGNFTEKCKDNNAEGEGAFEYDSDDFEIGASKGRNAKRYEYDSDEFEADEDVVYGTKKITVATVHRRDEDEETQQKPALKPQMSFEKESGDSIRNEGRNYERRESSAREFPARRKSSMGFGARRRSSIEYPIRRASIDSASVSGAAPGRHRKINMSFTNDRTREIQRENQILRQKLLKVQGSGITPAPPAPKEASSAIVRRRSEMKTRADNLILLRKIQEAKSSNLSFRR